MEFAVDSSEDMFAVGIVVLDKFCAGGWEIAVVAVMSPQLFTGIDFHNYSQLFINTVPFSNTIKHKSSFAHQTCWN